MSTPIAPRPGRRRAVFVDVDGTLIDHDILDLTAVDAVQFARANGHLVFLATGRAAGEIPPQVLAIGFDGVISNGGAFARLDGELVHKQVIPRVEVGQLLEFFEQTGIPFFFQADDAIYASEAIAENFVEFWKQRARTRAEHLERLNLPEAAVLARGDHVGRFLPLADADLDEIARAVFVSQEHGAVELARQELSGQFHVAPGSMPSPIGISGEIAPLGVSKGAAIEAVLAYLGISPADAIGIGDSWNDVEMFEVCGTAVAMGNAQPALQERADYVTTRVLEGGVKDALHHFGLV